MKIRYLLLTCLLGVLPLTSSQAQIGVSINLAPPVLPVYAQPPCPTDGYLWTPGYWAYDDYDGYYWVSGVWVAPPRIGFLWTPGYWGYGGGLYAFHQGYWGPTVGFYGGVNYGYGYGGNGYYGGRWDGRVFRYNTAVTRVNTVVIHNTYIDRVALNRGVTRSRASFNGPGGITARPTGAQLAAARGPHLAPTPLQATMRTQARSAGVRHAPVPAVRTAAGSPRPTLSKPAVRRDSPPARTAGNRPEPMVRRAPPAPRAPRIQRAPQAPRPQQSRPVQGKPAKEKP